MTAGGAAAGAVIASTSGPRPHASRHPDPPVHAAASSRAADPADSGLVGPASRPESVQVLLPRPTGRVVVISPVTAIYDAGGRYPSLRVFQYARPVPESRPFGSLDVDPGPIGNRKLLSETYGRDRRIASRFVDTAR